MENNSLLELKKAINDLACKLGDVPTISSNKRKIAEFLVGEGISKKAYGKSFFEIVKKVKEETGVMFYSSRVIYYMSDFERQNLTSAINSLTEYVSSKYQTINKQVYDNICDRAYSIGLSYKDLLKPHLKELINEMIKDAKRKYYFMMLEEKEKLEKEEKFLKEQEEFLRYESKFYHEQGLTDEEIYEALSKSDLDDIKRSH